MLESEDSTEAQHFLQQLSEVAQYSSHTKTTVVMSLLGLSQLPRPQKEALEREYVGVQDGRDAFRFLRKARVAYANEIVPARAAALRRSNLHRALERLRVPSLGSLRKAWTPLEKAYEDLRSSAGAGAGDLFRPWTEIEEEDGPISERRAVHERMIREAKRVQEKIGEKTWRTLLLEALQHNRSLLREGPVRELMRRTGIEAADVSFNAREAEGAEDAEDAQDAQDAGALVGGLPATLLVLLGDLQPRSADITLVQSALQEFVSASSDPTRRAIPVVRVLTSLQDAVSRLRDAQNVCRLPNEQVDEGMENVDVSANVEEQISTLELHAWRAVSATRRIVLLEHVFLQMLRTDTRSSASPGDLAHAVTRTVLHLAAAGIAFPALRITDFRWNGDRADFAGADLKPCFRDAESGRAWQALAALCMLDALFFTTYTAWRLAITQMVLESRGMRRPQVRDKVRLSAYTQLHQDHANSLLSSKLASKFQAAAMRDLWSTTDEPSLSHESPASLRDSTFFTVLGQHIFELWNAQGDEITRDATEIWARELLQTHERERASALATWKQQMSALVREMDESTSRAWILPLDTETALHGMPHWTPRSAPYKAALVTFEAKLLSVPRELRALLRRSFLFPGESKSQLRPILETKIMRPHLRYKAWPSQAPVDLGLESLLASSSAFFAPTSTLVSSMVRHRRLPDSFCPTKTASVYAPCTSERCPPAFRWNDSLSWNCGAFKGTRVCRGPLWSLSSLMTFLPTTRGGRGLVTHIYSAVDSFPRPTEVPRLPLPGTLSALARGARRLFVTQNALLDALFVLQLATEKKRHALEPADEVSVFLSRRAVELERMAHGQPPSSPRYPETDAATPETIAPLCARAAHSYAKAKDAFLAGVHAALEALGREDDDAETARRLSDFFREPCLLDFHDHNLDPLTLVAAQLFGPTWQLW